MTQYIRLWVFLSMLALPVACRQADPPRHETPHSHTRFEHAKTWTKLWDDPSRDEWQKPAEVMRLLAPIQGAVAVDLGAGTGYFLPHLSRAVGREGSVIALDIEPDLVRYMTERVKREGLANVEVRLVRPEEPGLAEGSIDRILMVDTWHLIEDRARYAARLGRSLRPGARVLVVEHTLESFQGPPVDERLLPLKVVEEFRKAGFDAGIANSSLPRQYVVLARWPG